MVKVGASDSPVSTKGKVEIAGQVIGLVIAHSPYVIFVRPMIF